MALTLLAAASLHAQEADWAWYVITSPDSKYAERRAVAAQAGRVLDLSWLATIEEERAKLAADTEPSQRLGDSSRVRAVPGTTYEIRSQVPWQWQVRNVLGEAWDSILNATEADAFMDWAASIPCQSDAEARFYGKATTAYVQKHPGRVPVEMIGAWRNLLLRNVREIESSVFASLAFQRDPDSRLFGQVLTLDRIEADPSNTFFVDLRPGMVPNTAVLAIARAALDQEKEEPVWRARTAELLLGALGEESPTSRVWQEPEQERKEVLRRFQEWFAEREDSFVRAAAEEQPALGRARRTLDQVEQCAAGERLPSP